MSATRSRQQGMTLIETMVACLVLMVGVVAMMGLFGVATRENATQGRQVVWLTTYAENKLAQLMALDFTDSTTDTTRWPAVPSGGTGLCALPPGTSCGSVDPAVPLPGFMDFLDAAGNLLSDARGAAFVRQWQIVADGTGTAKTITVTVRPLVGPTGGATLVATKYRGAF